MISACTRYSSNHQAFGTRLLHTMVDTDEARARLYATAAVGAPAVVRSFVTWTLVRGTRNKIEFLTRHTLTRFAVLRGNCGGKHA